MIRLVPLVPLTVYEVMHKPVTSSSSVTWSRSNRLIVLWSIDKRPFLKFRTQVFSSSLGHTSEMMPSLKANLRLYAVIESLNVSLLGWVCVSRSSVGCSASFRSCRVKRPSHFVLKFSVAKPSTYILDSFLLVPLKSETTSTEYLYSCWLPASYLNLPPSESSHGTKTIVLYCIVKWAQMNKVWRS